MPLPSPPRLTYDEKLAYCFRPEEIDGPDEAAWAEINAHLGTTATSLADLVRQLGERRSAACRAWATLSAVAAVSRLRLHASAVRPMGAI